MNKRHSQRTLAATIIGSMTLASLTAVQTVHANERATPRLGFTPITSNALPCSANGLIQFANDPKGNPLVPTVLMNAGEPATPLNAPATSTKVGRVNDMIALSADGKYLFTASENGIPTENGIGAAGSDGITRLTLKGKYAGDKVILADNVDAAGNALWQRIDGMKWYPFGGSTAKHDGSEEDDAAGILLASEEFGAGGIWQIDPVTGAFVRLDWLGNYSHEGIGIDASGNLYLADEARGGAIYKAVPADANDLTKGGALYYMVSTTVDASGWKLVNVAANASSEASTGGAILFDRPEDIDEANGRIYVAVTEPAVEAATHHGTAGQVVNRGGVYSFSATGVPEQAVQSGLLPYTALAPMIEVQDPHYASVGQAQAQQGLQFPDNLAFDGYGHLWVHEDIPDSSSLALPATGFDVSKQVRNQQDELYVFVLNEAGDAIVPNPDTTGPGESGGYKAADMRTSPGAAGHPCENEFTGGIFAKDGKTLYINQQHYDNPTEKVRIR